MGLFKNASSVRYFYISIRESQIQKYFKAAVNISNASWEVMIDVSASKEKYKSIKVFIAFHCYLLLTRHFYLQFNGK